MGPCVANSCASASLVEVLLLNRMPMTVVSSDIDFFYDVVANDPIATVASFTIIAGPCPHVHQ